MNGMAGRPLQMVLGAVALALGIAAAGCGGGGKSPSATATGGILTPGPTSATLRQAARITTRLAKAGYVVRPVKLPPSTIRGPIDVAAAAHGPQQTLIALTGDTDKLYASIN